MYVLKHNETGKYVADQRKRQGRSYTKNPEYAKIYTTREAAISDSCIKSEYVADIYSLLIR